MNKYQVRVYLTTYCDFEVDAKDEAEAIFLTDNKQLDMNQVLDNMCRTVEPCVIEI